MRRGKALLEGSRQGSVDGNSNLASDKELVHKCHSDPGGGRALGTAPRGHRHRSVSGALRKCVLTLDGYSYVIGLYFCWIYSDCKDMFHHFLISIGLPICMFITFFDK